MQLPDGTIADVTSLDLSGDTITATVTIAWPGGPKAQGWVSFTPTMNVTAGTIFAPGIADAKKPTPEAIDPAE